MSRPRVILTSAVTIDGRIASKSGYSKLSCPYDLKRLHAVRNFVDAIIVGANTIIVDNPELTVRYVEARRQPLKVVVDGRLRIPLDAKVFRGGNALVATLVTAPRDKVDRLKEMGVWVVEFEGEYVRMSDLLSKLYEMGVRRVMVEGGGRLNWHFVEEGLVDEVYLTVTGYVFGSGVSLFEGEGFEGLEGPKYYVRRVMLCECGREVLLHLVREGEGDAGDPFRDLRGLGIRRVIYA